MAAITRTIKGTGIVSASDFKQIQWTGKTKKGGSVQITFAKAINMGNIDWAFAEKDDTVAEITFTSVYSNTNDMVSATADYEEPWAITYADNSGTEAADEIMLGAGILSVGGVEVALTRGGGSFSVEREFREINADGDRGAVEGRIVMDGSRATLKVNALTFLTNMAGLYAGITVTTA